MPFTVGNAPPTLARVTGQPNPLIAGSISAPFTITVSGAGFTPATQVQVDRIGRSTTFVSQTEVRAVILPSDVTTPRLVPITVRNPGAVSSAPYYLPVLHPTPKVTAVSPNIVTALVALDAQAMRISVEGSGFVQSSTDASITSTVLVDNVPVDTEFVSPFQLIGIVPAALLSTGGARQISVKNPAPALGSSDAVTLFVSNPVPVISSVNAGPVTYAPSQPGETVWLNVAINGSDFSPTLWLGEPAMRYIRFPACADDTAHQFDADPRNDSDPLHRNVLTPGPDATTGRRCIEHIRLHRSRIDVGAFDSGVGPVNAISALALFAAAILALYPLPASAQSAAASTIVFPLIADGTANGIVYRSSIKIIPDDHTRPAMQCTLTQRGTGTAFTGLYGDRYFADVFAAGDRPAATTSIVLDPYRPWEVLRSTAASGLAVGYATLSCSAAAHAQLHVSLSDVKGIKLGETTLAPASPGTLFRIPSGPARRSRGRHIVGQ